MDHTSTEFTESHSKIPHYNPAEHLTLEEVAAVIGCTRQTVYNRVKKGEIEKVETPQGTFYTKESVRVAKWGPRSKGLEVLGVEEVEEQIAELRQRIEAAERKLDFVLFAVPGFQPPPPQLVGRAGLIQLGQDIEIALTVFDPKTFTLIEARRWLGLFGQANETVVRGLHQIGGPKAWWAATTWLVDIVEWLAEHPEEKAVPVYRVALSVLASWRDSVALGLFLTGCDAEKSRQLVNQVLTSKLEAQDANFKAVMERIRAGKPKAKVPRSAKNAKKAGDEAA